MSETVNRRSFLSILGIGAASLVLRPRCLRAADALPKLQFVLVSDTHLGYQGSEAAAKQWERTAAEIAQAPGRLVIHLGDVVDHGTESQYPLYVTTRKTIGKAVHEIPGNHDPQPLFQKYLRKEIDTTVDEQWLRFILMGNTHTDSHDGFLTAPQLDWLERQLEQARQDGQFVALCMHVPAHASKHPDRGWYIKPADGQTRLYELVKAHEDRVLALFHGHFHNGIRGWDDHAPVQEILFPSALYNQDRKLAEQKAPGYNLPEFRPGFTIVTIENGTLQLQYQVVGQEAAAAKSLKLAQLKA